MTELYFLTVVISFWISIVGGWSIISFEMDVDHAPKWWLMVRTKWWADFIVFIAIVFTVLPFVFLFILPN